MSDYRETFYNSYVSRYKGTTSQLSGDSLTPYFAMWKFKFLPLFKGLGPESTILELGCGPGYMLEFLTRCGFRQVKGIDVSSEQIEQANRRGCVAEVADVYEFLKDKHDTFDVILALDFVEHFHKEELLELALLIFTSLKKGGRLILQTPNGQGLFARQIVYGDITHITIFTPASLQQLLSESGFDNFRFSETSPTPQNMKGRLRLLLWQLVKFAANSVRRIEAGKSQTIWTENMICCCEKCN